MPQSKFDKLKSDIAARCADIKKTRWWRFGIVAFIYLLWVIWMGNAWLLLGLVLLFDIYITGYIPFTWWKKSKNKTVRAVMSWVDAIVYALILVYFVFNFIGQNYQIPSQSLERTLLTGDYLWVNKIVYGPRVPITPIHFPLVHNTMPLIGTKSYLETPTLKYHRLAGLRDVETGDIVVFNYPQGDTVALKIQNPDYYQICYDLQRNGVSDPRKFIASDPERFGEVVWRPVDRRENYVKRAIGLPGERLRIVDDQIFINGHKIATPDNVQFNYLIPVKGQIAPEKWMDLGVRIEDFSQQLIQDELHGIYYYNLPLTARMKAEVEKIREQVQNIE